MDSLPPTFDLVSFMEANGFRMEHKGGAATYITTCPMCGKAEHCGVTPEKNLFGCFKCSARGNLIYLVAIVSHKSIYEVSKMFEEELDFKSLDLLQIELPAKEEIKVKEKKQILMPEGYQFLGDRRIAYLNKRGITNEQVHYYKIGVCEWGRYKNRLIVCDVDEKGEVIYWIARDMTGKAKKKVLNPTLKYHGVGSAEIPFNFHLAKTYSTVILTEGVFDALYVGPNAIATYGACIKRGQRYLLASCHFGRVILLYDADINMEKLREQARMLASVYPVYICKLPEGDPDEYPRDQLYEFLEKSVLYKESELMEIPLP